MLPKATETFEAWQLRRFRRRITEHTGKSSSLAGYEGMIEELAWTLDHLDEDQRSRLDEVALETLFVNASVVALLSECARRAPRETARLLARLSPTTLRFLVGPLRTGPEGVTNHIADCRFRVEGGVRLCREACQQPTESFCARAGFPIVLEPAPDGRACTWTWGQERP